MERKSPGRSALPSVVEALQRLEARKSVLMKESQDLKIRSLPPITVSQEVIERHVKELVATLTQADPLELRAFLREHIQRIVVYATGRRRLYPTPDGLLHRALQAVEPACRKAGYAGSGI